MNARHSSFIAVALLLITVIALSGCSSKKMQPAFEPVYDDPYSFEAYLDKRKKADRSSMSQEERFAYDNRTASLSNMRQSGIPLSNLHLIEQAKAALGTPYVPGGTDPEGFDCSGFVQWAYRSVGVNLPRTAREQSGMGRPIKSGSMMAGDIVAFNHPRRGYHTGIYLGDGSFIHSPGRGKSVSIAALSDPYFSSTFIGARRVQSGESDAEAIKKLMALDSRHSSRAHKAALASSQKRSATRKQLSTTAAEHKTTRADARRRAPATPPAKQESAQSKKNGGATVAAQKQPTTAQTATKAAVKGTPTKKEIPGKQIAQAPDSKKSATTPKTAPEPAKPKAAPAKVGKDGKPAQPANAAKATAEKSQSAKPSPGAQKTAQAKTQPAEKSAPKSGAKAATPPSVKAAGQPKAAPQSSKASAAAPAKAAQPQKTAQTPKAPIKTPANAVPAKEKTAPKQPKPSEKAAPKQPAKTGPQNKGK